MSSDTADAPLHLDLFVPYRLSVLANIVSNSLARIYAERFDLTIMEWRVMAVLGLEETKNQPMSANSVAARTEMDKVQVSRAVSRMLKSGLISRSTDDEDRRRSRLELTERGRAVYREIVPAALKFEEELLRSFSTDEVMILDQLITRLTEAARELQHNGGD